MQVTCVGGGAASFFFAAHASTLYPDVNFTILEQGQNVLGKVLVSGGGRCNVTHHCFDPEELIHNYPRGGQELLGPFYHFGPQNTVDWFAQKGITLKTEEDGRMFPASNSSKTIIDCFTTICRRNGVNIQTSTKVKNIKPLDNGKSGFIIETLNSGALKADKVFVASGSSKPIWQILEHLGHTIVAPVPSLFTFQIKDLRLDGLSGISIPNAHLTISGSDIESDGPLLITHKGLSGPAVLKMSSRGARYFHEQNYSFEVNIDLRPDLSVQEIKSFRDSEGKKILGNHHIANIPKRLYTSLIKSSGLDGQKKLATLSKKEMETLVNLIKHSSFAVLGQNRFKEEFVTAGGVSLEEIDFSNFSSKLFPNIHCAGEVLNIDAITGGFNFQAAWTGAFVAAEGLFATL
jgi:predicted Rossmann fold flavoprotein